MKKVVIIGAGIAGLTCGVYAQKSGLQTEILEMHTIPGGECTGWDRGGYHFDGCVHWLTGSSPRNSLHKLWRTTGALNDNVPIINHETFARYEEDGRVVNLYTDADRLERHLLELSPQDRQLIKKLCKAIRLLGAFEMPIDKPMDKMTAGDGIRFMARNIDKFGLLNYFSSIPMTEYAQLYREPLIGRALRSAIADDFNAHAVVMSLASMNTGDGGFPAGGSRAMARRMERKYLSLGGKVAYRARAEHIIVKNGRAVGVALADGREVTGDYIVSCADGYHTLYHLLGDQYTPQVYRNLYANPAKYHVPTCALVYMGIGCELDETERSINIRREKPMQIAGVEADTVQILNYGFEKSLAPAGKTVMACYYSADYDYWHALHADGEAYKREKHLLAEDAMAAVIRRYPQAEGKIEQIDVVTPETYVRYCNAWRGSWMSWGNGGKGVPSYFPGELKGLEGFLMAGMWTLPPGGLPGAAASGRFAAHRICLKESIAFCGDE